MAESVAGVIEKALDEIFVLVVGNGFICGQHV